jgi:hypothetical protein
MRYAAALLVLLLLLPLAPAAAADSDLLLSKITYSLAGLVDAIASESDTTESHAERLAAARAIDANLDQYAKRYWTRMHRAYPESRDVCITDTLTGERNCTNGTSEAIVFEQVVALFGNSVKLQAVAAANLNQEERLAESTRPSPVVAENRKP